MNQCPKCSQTVYFAEKVLAIGRNWHKRCLRCESCGSSLTSSTLSDRDSKPLVELYYRGLNLEVEGNLADFVSNSLILGIVRIVILLNLEICRLEL